MLKSDKNIESKKACNVCIYVPAYPIVYDNDKERERERETERGREGGEEIQTYNNYSDINRQRRRSQKRGDRDREC